MQPTLFETGNFVVPTQVAIFLTGLLVGFVLLLRYGVRKGTHWRILLDAYLACMVCGIVVARLFVILQNMPWFREHTIQIFIFPVGGLSVYGGIAGGLFGLWLVSMFYRYHYLRLADALAVVFPFVLAVASIAALMQGALFGKLTDFPFAITMDHKDASAPLYFPRHPTQLYLALLATLLYIATLLTERFKMFHGQLTAIFLVVFPLLYGAVGFFRDDTLATALFGWHIGSVAVGLESIVAVISFGAGVTLFLTLRARRL